MTGAERRAQQAQWEAEFTADQNERPNVDVVDRPAQSDPLYCVLSPSRRHSTWTSKKDRKRRCYYCARVIETTKPAASPAGSTQPTA